MAGPRFPWPRVIWVFLLWPILTGAEPTDQAEAPVDPAQTSTPSDSNSGRHPENVLKTRDEVLVRQNPEATLWLETEEGRFPAMQTPSIRVAERGAVLLVADAGQSPAQGLVGEFHQVFSRLGWHVTSIGLPEVPLPERPQRASTSSPEPSSDEREAEQADSSAERARSSDHAITIDLASPVPSADDTEEFEAQAQARIDAALRTVQQQTPDITLMIGIGMGAVPLTQYLAQGSPLDRVALVWLMPRFQETRAPTLAPTGWLGGSRSWPILDITDSRLLEHGTEARQVAMAQLAGDASYRQDDIILARGGAGEADRLARRIHSWVVRQFDESD